MDATIWEKAKAIELEGRRWYDELARNAPTQELSGVFSLLAGEEAEHYERFCELEKQNTPVKAVTDSSIDKIKKVFADLAEQFTWSDDAIKALEGAVEAYQKAITLEDNSINYYSGLLNDFTDGPQKSAVKAILTEELRHAAVIRGMLDFVRRPREWLENAEFTHLEEY